MPDSAPPPGPFRALRFAPFEGVARYLDAIRQFDRNVRLFLTTTAFRGMVIATLQTVLNLYLYSLGYDARFIGLINAVNSIAVLLVSVPLGYLADRIGQRPVLLAGGVMYPLSLLGLSLAHSSSLILLFNFLFGIAASAYWVAGVPLLYASTREHERVNAFSINSFLLWGLGPVGALLGGQVVEIAAHLLGVSASSTSALRYGMYFIVALGVIGTLPYPFLRPIPPAVTSAVAPPPPGRLVALFIKLLLPDLLLAFGVGAVLTFAQLYFHLRFHLDAGPVGIVVAVGGLASGVATLLTPLLARRWGNLRTTVFAQWGTAPLLAALALSTQLPLALPSYWLVLMLRGMADPVYTTFIQERVPEAYRARLTGFYSVTYSIGYSLGPAASGQLQKIGGFTPAFLLGAVFYFLGATLLFTFFRPRRRSAGT
jgi:MFS family permease